MSLTWQTLANPEISSLYPDHMSCIRSNKFQNESGRSFTFKTVWQ